MYHTSDASYVKNVTGRLSFEQTAQDEDIRFSVNDGGSTSNILTLNSASSRVGIGTTSPGVKLDVAGDIGLKNNATYLYSKDTSGTSTRMFGINGGNTTYIGPIDSYAGGRMYYGASANMSGHNFYTGGTVRMKLDGYTLNLPNTGDWSYIKNDTNSGGLRFGTKDSGGNYANQIEISNTGNFVKLNENTTITGNLTVTGQASSFTRAGVESGTPNTPANKTTFTCNDAIESSSANQSGLQVWQDTSGADAFMTFHVAGDYAGYFGLDGSTNDLSWGGWSNGNGNKYKIWHAGNDGPGSGLNADLLDNLGAGSFLRSDATDTATGALTLSTQTWNGHITWNTGKNVYVGGESSFDVSGGGVFQIWDSGTGAPFIKCDVGQTVEIGQAGSRGLKVHGNLEATNSDVTVGNKHNPTLSIMNTATAGGSGPTLEFGHNQGGGSRAAAIKTYLTDGGTVNRTALLRFHHTQQNVDVLKLQLGDNYVRQYQKGDTSDYLETIVHDDYVNFHVASGNYIQITTDSGYCQIGPMNGSHNHIYTDRNSHYMNKPLYVLSNTLLNTSGNSYINNVNLGIGTTSPTKKLHVEGSTRLNGDVIVGPNNNNSKAFIKARNGYSSATTPDYTWYYNDQCGIYHPAGNTIGFSAGGEKVKIGTYGLYSADDIYIAHGGSDYSPGLQFMGGSNTPGANEYENAKIAYFDNSGSGHMRSYVNRNAGSHEWYIGGTRMLTIQADGDLELRSDGSSQGASIHRIGGLYFTWDRDSYGNNQQHAILCSSDDLIINSFDNVTINLDSNNNDTAEAFQVRRHGIDLTSGELLYSIDQSGNSYTMAASQVGNGSAAAPSLSFYNDTDLGFYRNGANNMRFTAGNSIRGTWNGDGLVLNGGSLGVNVAIPTTDGVIRAGNDVIAFYSSDERLKENVKPIENALDKVSKIRGVEFDWIVDKKIHANKGHDVGVIAQEIEKVLPEVVETRDNGYKAVKYEKIVSLLIEAVNEQQQQIDELKKGNFVIQTGD
jgi:hypothetical protein